MNYFDYKYFHLLMIMLFTYNLVVGIYNPQKKFFKISLGINSLILLGSGSMLLKRHGIAYAGPYPLWIWAKISCWFLLALIPPILIKRAPNITQKIQFIFLAIILIAIFMGVYKPQ